MSELPLDKIFPDDVLEHALNFGINATKVKFGISRGEIIKIVDDFSKDTCLHGNKCSCDETVDQFGYLFWACCPEKSGCNRGKNRRLIIKD